MSRQGLLEDIAQALKAFGSGSLEQNAISLFETLGYQSNRRIEGLQLSAANLAEAFSSTQRLRPEKALAGDWKSVHLLFQLTDDEISTAGHERQIRMVFDSASKVDPTIFRSYLFFAVALQGVSYTRGQLASITREVNRLFPMPVMVLFQHGAALTLAIIRRRPHQREPEKDVLEKVTLIKDIRLINPHRAHIEILADLALLELYERHRFTNFLELHKAWQDTLNISALNKRFYKDLANWYFWAVKNVTFPVGAGEDEETRNATSVIRLITRLIFVWFIKEKGLVPEVLFDPVKLKEILKEPYPCESIYYKAILQNLFFATLNTEMGEGRRFRGRNKNPNGMDAHHGISTVYRFESCFKDTNVALRLFEGIPFLNGGLFECFDKPEQKVYIDGFSDNPKNQPSVPDELFFGEEHEIDLNDVYWTKNKRYKVRGLIDIFNHYKFTIEENTPIEEEVALDPELLGKVFENLLAAYNPETGITARKQTGSFYTPREIVNYMVDEALAAYLENAIIPSSTPYSQPEGVREKLRALLAYDEKPHGFSEDIVTKLIAAIDTIKVLDPACGSGAFPMGILHKLVHILNKLDPENTRWKEKQIAKAVELSDATVREHVIVDIEQAFSENKLDYGRKLYLIENCIYGVDIQPIAVQIAKLRFFISLVVEQTTDFAKENLGVRPLPNLETKFVAANTLIGIDRTMQMPLLSPAIIGKEKDLANIRSSLFIAKTPATKRKYRELDARLRAELSMLLRNYGMGSATAHQLAEWNPYDQNTSVGFFDPEWMFNLPNGFDVVIGNPPYLRVQGIQKTQSEFMPYYRGHFDSTTGNFDLYALFIEKGYKLLARSGQLAYIVPHKFFQASFGKGLREILTNRKALRQVVRFGAEQVFEESTTYTCLLFLSTHVNIQFDLIEVKSLGRGEDVLQAVRERVEHPDYAFETLPEPAQSENWDFTIGEHSYILGRLQQHPRRLQDFTRKIFQGLATSGDKLYVLEVVGENGNIFSCYSKQMNKIVEIERGLVKPFLMGKDIHRYHPLIPKNVVIFPYILRYGKAELMPQSYIQKEFPKGWKYLHDNENDFAARERGRMVGEQFYAYIYRKNLTEFETVKIVTPDICNVPEMSIDFSGKLYHTGTVYSFVFKPGVKQSVKFFLGLLNSRVLRYFLSLTGTVLRHGYLRFKTEYLKPFPIAESTPEQEHSIDTLVDYVLTLKALPAPSNRDQEVERSLMIAYFEQLIDGLVYELYFPEEFSDAGKSFYKELASVELPVLSKLSGKSESALQGIFRKLYDNQHPVRQMIFFLDTIEAVRVIEGKTRKE